MSQGSFPAQYESINRIHRSQEAGHLLAFLSFLHLGAAVLFPWNAIITAADFWSTQFEGKHCDRLFTVVYLPVNLAVLALMIHFHTAITPRLRVLAGMLGFTLAMIAIPALDWFFLPSDTTLVALLVLVGLCGACDGLAQGALFGEAALLPPRFTGALIAGIATSGVAVSVLRIATKAALPATYAGMRLSAVVYFLISAAVTLAAALVYVLLPRLPVIKRYREEALEAALEPGLEHGLEEHQDSDDELAFECQHEPPRSPYRRRGPDLELSADLELPHTTQHRHVVASLERWARGGGKAATGASTGTESCADASLQEELLSGAGAQRHGAPKLGRRVSTAWRQGAAVSYVVLLRRIWRLAAAVTCTYVVTLCIFPGVLAEDVHSVVLGSWYPVLLLTAYNVADWASRLAASSKHVRVRSPTGLLAASLARFLLIPAFHLAATHGAGLGAVGALTLILGCSNGYLTSCCMMAAPEGLHGRAANLAGNLMVFALCLGLSMGAASSFVWLL